MQTCELTIRQTIGAEADQLYGLWLDPSQPGGPWFGTKRIIERPEVRTWSHYGRFTAIDPPRSIVYTSVSVHAGVPDTDEGRKHEQGWRCMLTALAEHFAA